MVQVRRHIPALLPWLLLGCGVDPVKESPAEPLPIAVAEPCSPLKVALSQAGVVEQGGNNRGAEVKQYLASVGLPEGHAWCAAFVHWCYRECGTVIEPKRKFAMALEWHKQPQRVWGKGAWQRDADDRISEDGDHFALWSGHLGRIGHTGLIRGEDDDYILTIEGNTSSGGSREGDGCYLRRRLKRTIHCISRWPTQSNDGQQTHMGSLRGVPRVQPR